MTFFESVNYTLQPVQEQAVWDGVIQKDSMWAFADQGSYKMTLRKTLKNWTKIKERSVELANIIDEKYSDDKLYENFVNQVYGDKIVEDDEIDALFASLAEE